MNFLESGIWRGWVFGFARIGPEAGIFAECGPSHRCLPISGPKMTNACKISPWPNCRPLQLKPANK